jgi:hypothetical protein
MLPVELPTFEATWWPLHMETIPGSGEIIAVAVMVRAASGQASIRQVVQPPVLSAMFGSDVGKGVHTMVAASVIEVQRQLDDGTAAEQAKLPMGGFRFGPARDAVARDLNEVFDVAVRLTCAFGQSAFGRQATIGDSSRRAFEDWADRVRLDLITHDQAELFSSGAIFNVRVKLARKSVQFGLLHDGCAVNFGVLRPGFTSGDMRSLKVKVFDLEALRRDQILPINTASVLAGCPPQEALAAFSRREVGTFHESLEFIEAEAKVRHVKFVRCASPDEAGEYIRAELKAA